MTTWIAGCVSTVMTIAIWLLIPRCAHSMLRLCRFVTEKTNPEYSLVPSIRSVKASVSSSISLENHLQRFSDGKSVYRAVYVVTRLIAGVSACALPFLISTFPQVSIALSLCIVCAVVVDRVFTPRGNLGLHLIAEQKLQSLISKTDIDEEQRQKILGEILNAFNKGYIQLLFDMEIVMTKIEVQPK